MAARRVIMLISVAVLCAVGAVGCSHGDGGAVDAPLMKNAPPPPPRPDKPTLKPGTGGGGKG